MEDWNTASSPVDHSGTSRTVASAIVVLTWTFASAFALRGLNLRLRVLASVHTAPQITVKRGPAQPEGPAPGTLRQLDR
ncbi:hypothetical protein [Streptomyces sp. enrichment culture]|uniref:hypothetical protein n=1 Tax=Streptomyces sp. enrichment culture TaxID=1795815 RepID=UPI003F57F643